MLEEKRSRRLRCLSSSASEESATPAQPVIAEHSAECGEHAVPDPEIAEPEPGRMGAGRPANSFRLSLWGSGKRRSARLRTRADGRLQNNNAEGGAVPGTPAASHRTSARVFEWRLPVADLYRARSFRCAVRVMEQIPAGSTPLREQLNRGVASTGSKALPG
jgi:hypothetical protein